ncbi:MAG: hypothetical protein NT105_04490 [Verrucomicrobia bacterium]|nr:hypothetical protein [Verrucomicrobiota bacterium]
MSIRNKKMDRRDRFMERRRMAELREAMAESLFEAFHAGRLIPARAVATTAFRWPAPPGER